MIIISNKPGQLGNLLFIYSGFLAYSIETGIPVLNPAFYPYKSYFTGTIASLSINKYFYLFCFFVARLCHKLKIKTRFIHVIALDNGEYADLEKTAELQSTLCFVQGWLFRADPLLLKHKKEITDFFSPTDQLKKRIDRFFEQNFKPGEDLLIAVHIRHGDYKTFQNGIYYYSLDQYTAIVRELNRLFKDQQPHFLICSNEKIDSEILLKEQISVKHAPGHELLDMYCMARCNYIAGPPSTYTLWASFVGNVPLYAIHDLKRPILKNDFVVHVPGHKH